MYLQLMYFQYFHMPRLRHFACKADRAVATNQAVRQLPAAAAAADCNISSVDPAVRLFPIVGAFLTQQTLPALVLLSLVSRGLFPPSLRCTVWQLQGTNP